MTEQARRTTGDGQSASPQEHLSGATDIEVETAIRDAESSVHRLSAPPAYEVQPGATLSDALGISEQRLPGLTRDHLEARILNALPEGQGPVVISTLGADGPGIVGSEIIVTINTETAVQTIRLRSEPDTYTIVLSSTRALEPVDSAQDYATAVVKLLRIVAENVSE
jgi:hypothetical protein